MISMMKAVLGVGVDVHVGEGLGRTVRLALKEVWYVLCTVGAGLGCR